MVKGIVKDQDGELMDGVNVFYTDLEGNVINPSGASTGPYANVFPGGYFQLEFLPGGVLNFTHIGYGDKLMFLPASEPDFLEIEMTAGAYELDEVVITPDDGEKSNWLLLALAALAVSKM